MLVTKRRRLLHGAALVASSLLVVNNVAHGQSGDDQNRSEWEVFRRRHVTNEGRVVDNANAGVSHSESQSYSLYVAARVDDRENFDRILAWTIANLRVRKNDGLLAWRWRPGAGVDNNNATDGDLFFAGALSIAGERWGASYTSKAVDSARDVLRVLSIKNGQRSLLLPGADGFVNGNHLMLNPSYHSPRILKAIDKAFPDPAWERISRSERELVEQCRFGPLSLPSDWITLGRNGGMPQPHPDKPQTFGYDAVRVPLQSAWSGYGTESPILASCAAAWRLPSMTPMPGTISLPSGERGQWQAAPGILAIASLSFATLAHAAEVTLPPVDKSPDYYSAALTLLVRLAARDLGMEVKIAV